MCRPAENSLEQNLSAQAEMLRRGIVNLSQIPGLTADAENARRTYLALMEQAGWTEEELFQRTGYRLSTLTSPINNLTI